jgi:hypothetical protein
VPLLLGFGVDLVSALGFSSILVDLVSAHAIAHE